jgi:hypothetical protein
MQKKCSPGLNNKFLKTNSEALIDSKNYLKLILNGKNVIMNYLDVGGEHRQGEDEEGHWSVRHVC